MRMIALAGLALALAASLGAQEPAFELTVPNIMRGPEHVGEPPGSVRWTDDGQWIYFRWKPGGVAWHQDPSFYRVPARGGAPAEVDEAHMDSIAPFLTGGDLTLDRRWRVTSHDGDLWLVDRRRNQPRRLTRTNDTERSPTFSRDGTTVYFLRDDNVFALELETSALRQITDVRRGDAPRDPREAEGMRRDTWRSSSSSCSRPSAARSSGARSGRNVERARADEEPEPIRTLGREESLHGAHGLPQERWALIQVGRPAATPADHGPRLRHGQRLHAAAQRPEQGGRRPGHVRVGVVDVATGGAVTWLDLAPGVTDPESDADSVGLPTGTSPSWAMAILPGLEPGRHAGAGRGT
jgi:hypothetical protein